MASANRRQILLLMSGLLLGACQSTPPAEPTPANPDEPGQQAHSAESVPAPVPTRPMQPEVMELLLEAELSGYRGDQLHALDTYLEAARLSGDLELIRFCLSLAIDMGSTDRAMQAAVLWHEKDPENPDALAAAVQLLARVGEAESAWFLAEQGDPELIRTIAIESAAQGNFEQLVWLDEEISLWSSMHPDNVDALAARAMLADLFGRHTQASQLAANALALDGDDELAMQVRADALIKSGDWQSAQRELDEFMQRNFNQLSEAESLTGLYYRLPAQAAANSLEQLFNKYPERLDLLLLTAENLLRANRLEQAEALYLGILDDPAHREMAQFQLALIAERRGQIDLAVARFAEIPLGSYFEQAQQRIFELLSEANQFSSLLQEMKKQRQRYPRLGSNLYSLQAQQLQSVLPPAELMQFYDQAVNDYPDSIDLRYARSLLAEQMDQLAKTELDLRHILELNPDDANALNALGYTLTNRTDRHQEAFGLINRALQLDPDNPAIQDSMGWVLYKLGRYEEALQFLALAQAAFYDPEVIAHHAEVLYAMGRVDEALDLIGQAMLEFPGDELLREARRRILESP